MVIGVFQEELIDIMANSLIEIGNVDHGVVIYGVGLDEIERHILTALHTATKHGPDHSHEHSHEHSH